MAELSVVEKTTGEVVCEVWSGWGSGPEALLKEPRLDRVTGEKFVEVLGKRIDGVVFEVQGGDE